MNITKIIKNRFSKGIHEERAAKERAANKNKNNNAPIGDEKDAVAASPSSSSLVTEEEWKTSARALRTASWGTIFYIITTDILGWSTCP